MKSVSKILIITVLLIFSTSAWSASTKQEVLELSAQVEEMQKDLAEIKKLLQQGAKAPAKKAAEAPFKPRVVSVGDSIYLGKEDAPLTMIEYSDYQCPFCARHHRDVMPTLIEEYIDTGKLKFVMREHPLDSIHRDANNASLAALCAGDQGKYWEMQDMLFENQRDLYIDNLKSFGDSIGLDATIFGECLDSKKYQKRIRGDLASGGKLGIRGTPGFAIGLTDQNDPDKANMSILVKGSMSLSFFKMDLEKLLKSTEKAKN
jgi:protein-disulfide isomerase